ncbi:MAG: acyl carrier protein [Clostridia bacterium]|nr:acyl carrier protein [Clostridia bacterium]
MTREEITVKLKDLFDLVLKDDDSPDLELTEDTNLVTDMGLSSVGVLYAVVAVEEFFNIRFDDVGFSDFSTVKDVIDYIEKKVNA